MPFVFPLSGLGAHTSRMSNPAAGEPADAARIRARYFRAGTAAYDTGGIG
jgi:hypothetical protein